jgi:hypothetical protein
MSSSSDANMAGMTDLTIMRTPHRGHGRMNVGRLETATPVRGIKNPLNCPIVEIQCLESPAVKKNLCNAHISVALQRPQRSRRYPAARQPMRAQPAGSDPIANG